MNKARLWRAFFVIIVLGIIGFAVNRTVHLNRLANLLLNGTPEQQIEAAKELIARDKLFEKMQVMDSTDRLKIMDVLVKIPGEETVKAVIPLFKDTEAKLRTNTKMIETENEIRGLQFYQDEKTRKMNAPLLKEALKKKAQLKKLQDDETALHAKIVDVLKVIGKDHLDILTNEMKNPDALVSIGVKDTLVAIGEKAIPYMHRAAMEDDLRPHAFEVLARIGEPSVPTLIKLLNYKVGSAETQDIRMGAANALGTIASKKATMALIQAANHDTEAVRRVAISSLCAIRDPRSVDVLIYALTHTRDDGEVRARCATALSAIGGTKAINALVSVLDDSDLKVRSSAISGLQRIGAPAVKAVAAAIATGNPIMARSGAMVLERINSPEANNVLLTLSKHRDPEIRASAVRGLGFQTSTDNTKVLIAMLSDKDGKVGDALIEVLSNMQSKVLDSLIAVINSNANELAKYRAATALGKIGSPAVAALSSLLAKGGQNARWAAYALGLTGDPKAKAILKKYASIGDPNMEVIVRAALCRP